MTHRFVKVSRGDDHRFVIELKRLFDGSHRDSDGTLEVSEAEAIEIDVCIRYLLQNRNFKTIIGDPGTHNGVLFNPRQTAAALKRVGAAGDKKGGAS